MKKIRARSCAICGKQTPGSFAYTWAIEPLRKLGLTKAAGDYAHHGCILRAREKMKKILEGKGAKS